MNINIRRVYLYLTSLIGLVLVLIGGVQIINLGLKTWILTKADDQYYSGPCYKNERTTAPMKEGEQPQELSDEECEAQRAEEKTARRQNQAANAIAFIVVGVPVWLYHWNKVKGERDTATPA